MGAKIRLSWGHKVEVNTIKRKRLPLGTIEAEALAALADAATALDASGVGWWLTYGALLGLVREGGLIPWDNDFDFAIVAGRRRKAMLSELVARGFYRVNQDLVDGESVVEKLQRGNIIIDCILLREAGPLWEDRIRYDDHSICVGTHPRMAVVRQKLSGVDVAVPVDAEAYVAHLYGPDWRVPVKNWDYRHSPPNVTIHLSWWSGVLMLWDRASVTLSTVTQRIASFARRVRKSVRRRLKRLLRA